MEYILRLAHSYVVYLLVPILVLLVWYRLRKRKVVRYRYPLTALLESAGVTSNHYFKKILFVMRFVALSILIFLIAKPQWVDPRSTVKVEGIDIMLVLDVSGSMSWPNSQNDQRMRIEVAKEEAIHFVNKRTNDAIGLVLFANDALSRCPLTMDKSVLNRMINEVEIGMVPPVGTLISTAVLTAANRLKRSKAKSKVMILLTDGQPNGPDVDPQTAIEVAKQLGIRIYTIGIGDNQEIMMPHPTMGYVIGKSELDKPLLTAMATRTGGKFFEAQKPDDMRRIYDTIDALEKTEIEAQVFTHYIDWFMPFLWIVVALMFVEMVMTTFFWFSVTV